MEKSATYFSSSNTTRLEFSGGQSTSGSGLDAVFSISRAGDIEQLEFRQVRACAGMLAG